MDNQQKKFSEKTVLELIQRALRRAALIYHHFSDTLIQELGEEKGRELIRKAVDAYGNQIGREARQKTEARNQEPKPENFHGDLPEIAWKTETVTVAGEERIRVHHCPLAHEWLEWGDAALARLYCFVDQAKMAGFNPDYEYIHIKNLLDGDPYCELVVRPVKKTDREKQTEETDPSDTVKWIYGRYSRDDLMRMNPVCLRALFRERVHHTIEVELYPILLGEKEIPPYFGRQPQLILDVWKDRGLPHDGPDWEWGKIYLELAAKLRQGEKIEIDEPMPIPFSQEEMAVVKKLIWERHSVRNWIPGKEIPEEMITKILEAGRAAPTGCNLDVVRFVVIRDPEEAQMVWSDIPTPMDRCVLIIVGYDTRIYKTVGHDRLVPHNQLYDCAAAADHMCLAAHALGLGAVWLTRTEKTGRAFKEKYGLPDYIEPALHIAVGWPATASIKSARMPLQEMLISRTES